MDLHTNGIYYMSTKLDAKNPLTHTLKLPIGRVSQHKQEILVCVLRLRIWWSW